MGTIHDSSGNGIGQDNPLPISSSAQGLSSVTPNDGIDLPKGATKGISFGIAGDVKVTMYDDSVGVIPNLAAGMIHPISAKRIWSTGTTAINITAFY